MTVRAKFVVESNEPAKAGDSNPNAHNVTMRAVYSHEPGSENNEYWKYTPAGYLSLSTVNPNAWQQLERGREYYIDITPADE